MKKGTNNLTAEISLLSYSNAVNSQHDMDMERVNEGEEEEEETCCEAHVRFTYLLCLLLLTIYLHHQNR